MIIIKSAYTSLVPTHYRMILDLPEEIKNDKDVSSIRQLLISSAPAGKDLKLAIMNYFKNAELWEAYGSTEGGLGTLLRPEDQFKKLEPSARRFSGPTASSFLTRIEMRSRRVKWANCFTEPLASSKSISRTRKRQWRLSEGEWFSAGDMAKRDADGYYTLVDRKANMIITGGENVYPSEVENVLRAHEAVKEVAVIGVPDEKWGEKIKAVVVPADGYEAGEALAREILEFSRDKIAGYKRPKSIDFIKEDEMPRTPTGKIVHRVLKSFYA